MQEWSDIQQQLHQLEKEELVVTEQQETLVIRITHAGLALVKEQLETARLSGQ